MTKKFRYNYFIVFTYKDNGFNNFGNYTLESDNKINVDSLIEVTNNICKEYNLQKVVVLNCIEL